MTQASAISQAPPGSSYPTTEQVVAALTEAPLREIEAPSEVVHVNAPHAALAEALLRVVRNRTSEALICWPSQPDGVSVIHHLACLALSHRAPFETPSKLRVLYLPWNTRAGASSKRTLVDREWLRSLHIKAINRELQGTADRVGGELFKWHSVMNRLKDLDGVVTHRGRSKVIEAFRHPTLAELSATAVCGGAVKALPMLHRVRKHTVIGRLGAVERMDTVERCPFAFFGMQVGPGPLVAEGACQQLDAILLNALQRRCDAIGYGWQKRLREALLAVMRAQGRIVPVLAITDDTWIQHVLVKDVLGKLGQAYDLGRVTKSSVLMEPCRITEARTPYLASGAEQIQMEAPGGVPASIEDCYRSLIDDAFSAGEEQVGALLLESRTAFRRFATLPASLESWKDYLFKESDLSSEEAADVLSGLDARKPLGEVVAQYPEALSVQCNRSEIDQLLASIAQYVQQHASQSTATAEMLRALVQQAKAEGKRAVVVLADERLREFFERVVEGIGSPATQSPGEVEAISVVSLRQFQNIAEGRLPWPMDLERAIILGPGRKRLMQLMGARRLPSLVQVIVDVGVARAVAADAAHLQTRDAFRPLAERLDRLSLAALECCQRCASQLPSLEWQQPPPPEFESGAFAGVVDLRSEGGKGEGVELRITTDSRSVLLARPRSKIVRFDPDAAIDPYREDFAENIRPGDRVCVLSRDFFDWVRDRLGSGTAVAGEVRAYHQFVAERVSGLPGRNYTERAAHICRLMKARGREVPESRVLDWIRADRWLAQDDATVRPHAPWHYEDFHLFLSVLGAPDVLAESLWRFGVLMTRSARLSAANQFGEMCIGILTRTTDMLDQYRSRKSDILAVVAKAESTVATVASVERSGDVVLR